MHYLFGEPLNQSTITARNRVHPYPIPKGQSPLPYVSIETPFSRFIDLYLPRTIPKGKPYLSLVDDTFIETKIVLPDSFVIVCAFHSNTATVLPTQ